MRKPAFCICENKDADQLRGDREADQCLCFRYTDSTIPLLLKSKISSLFCDCTARFVQLSTPLFMQCLKFSAVHSIDIIKTIQWPTWKLSSTCSIFYWSETIEVIGFYVPPTAKAIQRQKLGQKSHLKD